MKTKNIYIFSIIFLSALFAPTISAQAETLAERLSGKILLQVEQNGEAWYVNPSNNKRYFLGRPEDAFSAMRRVADIKQIMTAVEILYNDVAEYPDEIYPSISNSMGPIIASTYKSPENINEICDGVNEYVYTVDEDKQGYKLKYCQAQYLLE